MPKSTLKRLPPKKRPRKAKAGTRGADAAQAVLAELTGQPHVPRRVGFLP